MGKRVGKRSVALDAPPVIIASACTVGGKEGEGPLKDSFDTISDDSYFGEKTWEKAESRMIKNTVASVLAKAALSPGDIELAFAGDLVNQCTVSSFGLRESGIPYFGVYGACSTMAETLALASMAVSSGFASNAMAVTSSHFSTAERQYRMPLEYGGQRPPTSQWTVTGCGALIISSGGAGPRVTGITPGVITDAGITDANNMGAAMAPAAHDTLTAHFEDFGRTPSYYDLIVTGDLGFTGADILRDLCRRDGVELGSGYTDCGMLIFDREKQDVHSGGSGCGCSASVLSGYILNGMRSGRWKKVLFAATGALLSPTTTMQGESVPSIACAVSIEV